MRGQSVLGSLIIAAVTLALLAAFSMPVIEGMRDNRVSALTGNADASAAMIYALLAPILLTLTRGLAARLVALAIAGSLAWATRTWVHLVEAEALGLALALTVACIAAVVMVVVALRSLGKRRRGHVAVLAWTLARSAAQVTEHLRRRYGASSGNGRADGPLNQVLLVENLVFNVLAAAAPEATREDFAATVVQGLAEMRDGLTGNTITDPQGYGAIAAAEYCARLSADLRRLVPGGPAVPAPGAALPGAPRRRPVALSGNQRRMA